MNLQEQRTRLVLIILAAVFVTLIILGQCVFDVGAAVQIGGMGRCVYPPHVCQQP